jgi:hypothetical protein
VAKKCFLSFYYKPDSWRVSQVKQMGAVEGQPLLDHNKWEEIEKKGDAAVEKWIDDNMKGKECLVVLVGEKTSGRRWVKYEIKKAWTNGIGIMAIHIHGLKDSDEKQSKKGSDPFTGVTVDGEAVKGKVYDPPYSVSTNVYTHISDNIEKWVKDAIAAR